MGMKYTFWVTSFPLSPSPSLLQWNDFVLCVTHVLFFICVYMLLQDLEFPLKIVNGCAKNEAIVVPSLVATKMGEINLAGPVPKGIL